MTLTTRGLEAWDERFDHIDRQHFNKDQTIDQWYPLNKDLPIGEMLPSDSVNTDPSLGADEDDSVDEDSSDEADQDELTRSSIGDEAQSQFSANTKRVINRATDEDRASKRQARDTGPASGRVWFCVSHALEDDTHCTENT